LLFCSFHERKGLVKMIICPLVAWRAAQCDRGVVELTKVVLLICVGWWRHTHETRGPRFRHMRSNGDAETSGGACEIEFLPSADMRYQQAGLLSALMEALLLLTEALVVLHQLLWWLAGARPMSTESIKSAVRLPGASAGGDTPPLATLLSRCLLILSALWFLSLFPFSPFFLAALPPPVWVPVPGFWKQFHPPRAATLREHAFLLFGFQV